MTNWESERELKLAVAPFEPPDFNTSICQLLTSTGLFVASCAVMYWLVGISYFLTLVLTIPTGGLLLRIFIIQHDCGHGSFFASRRVNDAVGMFCSVLTLTPYLYWRRYHAAHHAIWNNLDRREPGADIYSTCLTVKEYCSFNLWQRFIHRLPRHPIVANLVIPSLVFLLAYRNPFATPKSWVAERWAILGTNLALAAIFLLVGSAAGFSTVVKVHVPVIMVATIVGFWLFSVQHRFESALWLREPDWTFVRASMRGASYLELPGILRWFTGNIGYHHIHHLSPRIPNYRLQECYRAVPAMREHLPLKLWPALKAVWFVLWDEDRGQMVSFRDVHIRAPV